MLVADLHGSRFLGSEVTLIFFCSQKLGFNGAPCVWVLLSYGGLQLTVA